MCHVGSDRSALVQDLANSSSRDAKQPRKLIFVTDELLSDLDAAVSSLLRARAKLKLYRASILKAAVEGELTAEWRAQHPHTEPASELLKRILAERRHRWEEEQLAKFKQTGKEPPKNWRSNYKDPRRPESAADWHIPSTWEWSGFEELSDGTSHSIKAGPFWKFAEERVLFANRLQDIWSRTGHPKRSVLWRLFH